MGRVPRCVVFVMRKLVTLLYMLGEVEGAMKLLAASQDRCIDVMSSFHKHITSRCSGLTRVHVRVVIM